MDAAHVSRLFFLAATAAAVSAQDPVDASQRPGADQRPEVTDTTVSDRVDRELLVDVAVPSHKLDVRANNGVITLTGSVDNILAKERAVRIAETVKGVRAVIDRIDVAPGQGDDAKIRNMIHNALVDDPATDSLEAKVDVLEGHVTLTGTVDSWAEKELCATVAKGVRGVTGLTNDLSVEYDDSRPNAEIQADVEQRLRWDHLVDGALVDVSVEDGKVTLRGTVGSAAEKRRVRMHAWNPGVLFVDDSMLEVERWARDEDLRGGKYAPRDDEAVRSAVDAAMLYDPRVTSFDVRVEVGGGHVALRGTVDNLKARRAAEEDARNTVGVLSVENYIKVRPDDERSDAEIASGVERAIQRDPYVSDLAIDVSVRNGLARLDGTVGSYFEKHHADDVASRVKGVVDIVNNLDVSRPYPLAYDPWIDPWSSSHYHYLETRLTTDRPDPEIAAAIEDELWWSPFVDSDDIEVTVENGVATLNGTVESWAEWRAVRENAFDGGAVLIENSVCVEP